MALEAGQLLQQLETSANELMLETEQKQSLYLNNLNQVIWHPLTDSGNNSSGTMNKRQVMAYYANIIKSLMPYLQGQPITPLLYPNGIEEDYFYPILYPNQIPPYVQLSIHSDTGKTAILMENIETLFYLLNLGAISFDFPLKRCLIIQLYGQKAETTFSSISSLALITKGLLEKEYGTSYIKPFQFSHYPTEATSNKQTDWHGLDMIIPFLHSTAYLNKVCQELYTTLSQTQEASSLHLCCKFQQQLLYAMPLGQAFSQNTIDSVIPECFAPFSLMACNKPLVSTPIGWDELETAQGQPDYWTWENVLEDSHNRRIAWSGFTV